MLAQFDKIIVEARGCFLLPNLDASPILGGPKPISPEENEPAPIHEPGHDTATGNAKKKRNGVISYPLLPPKLSIFGRIL